jgi:hypothetical protein
MENNSNPSSQVVVKEQEFKRFPMNNNQSSSGSMKTPEFSIGGFRPISSGKIRLKKVMWVTRGTMTRIKLAMPKTTSFRLQTYITKQCPRFSGPLVMRSWSKVISGRMSMGKRYQPRRNPRQVKCSILTMGRLSVHRRTYQLRISSIEKMRPLSQIFKWSIIQTMVPR